MLDPVEGTVSCAERENRDDFLLIFRGEFNAALPPSSNSALELFLDRLETRDDSKEDE